MQWCKRLKDDDHNLKSARANKKYASFDRARESYVPSNGLTKVTPFHRLPVGSLIFKNVSGQREHEREHESEYEHEREHESEHESGHEHDSESEGECEHESEHESGREHAPLAAAGTRTSRTDTCPRPSGSAGRG